MSRISAPARQAIATAVAGGDVGVGGIEEHAAQPAGGEQDGAGDGWERLGGCAVEHHDAANSVRPMSRSVSSRSCGTRRSGSEAALW